MICISLNINTRKELSEKLRKANRLKPDFIELRIRKTPYFSLKQIPRKNPVPLIFTCRIKNKNKRLDLTQKALNSGCFKYVDLDYKDFTKIKKRHTRIIVSYHNYKKTPSYLKLIATFNRLSKAKPDLIKIATMANDISDNFRIFRLLKYAKNKTSLISFCMGESGLISRVLYRKFKSQMTYSSLNNEPTASGQISYQLMKNLYGADKINNHWRVYGLIGNPVKYSLSPYLFNYLFRQYKINSVYLPFLIRDLKIFPELTRILKIKGYSITMPYKEKIADFKKVISLDKEAKKINTINTAYRKKNKLIGTNTDGKGALLSLKNIKVKRVLILGAGGTASTIAYELIKKGIVVIIANRHYHKARKLASILGCQAIHWNKIKSNIGSTDTLINTTPVGMMPNHKKTPIPKNILNKKITVFDTVYQPPLTKLLKISKQKKCRVISGLDMFINQACLQFNLFSGKRIDIYSLSN